MMQGLTWTSLKHHKALIPLFISVGTGAAFAAFYVARLALKNPDATWRRGSNPYPWQNIKPNQNIKFYSAGKIDFQNLKKNGPEF
ncbi:cytochrome c oxidase subunit NDUFA4-like [Lytechinus variegatus]|uniref:cytochrome c oxidase subunit NDUFA4-like n=1 Tax=Lytechinus variegatus TaxID=7654 RepID=UPI001BB2771E|nr:cytochrome c oxidase subunit NDUFA4-like [Lytechinus variegatus]